MPHKNGRTATDNPSFQQLLDDVKTVVRDGEQLLRISAKQLKEKARTRAQSTDHLVRSYPYRVMFFVFAAGFATGVWASRSHRSYSDDD
jgi:ElaB/YqjD/DUF883 family membrane-anchored ribosome-binding protein